MVWTATHRHTSNRTHYSSYYSNSYYSLIRTSIVATIVLLEINGGSELDWFPTLIKLHFRYAYYYADKLLKGENQSRSEHRYSSRLSGSLL